MIRDGLEVGRRSLLLGLLLSLLLGTLDALELAADARKLGLDGLVLAQLRVTLDLRLDCIEAIRDGLEVSRCRLLLDRLPLKHESISGILLLSSLEALELAADALELRLDSLIIVEIWAALNLGLDRLKALRDALEVSRGSLVGTLQAVELACAYEGATA